MKKRFKASILISAIMLYLCSIGSIQAQNRKIDTLSIEKIFTQGLYSPKTPAGLKYRLSGDSYYILKDNELIRVSKNSKTEEVKETIILNWESEAVKWGFPKDVKLWSFLWNKDKNILVLLSDKSTIYRHSYSTNAYLFKINSSSKTEMLEVQAAYALSSNSKIELPSFSGDGSKIAYVKNNNLYYVDIFAGNDFKEIGVTNDGKTNDILNGKTDWVYEEEFGVPKAYEWSADGKYLAYLRFDEGDLKQYGMTMWGDLYPSDYVYKYPKAGEKNSDVTLYVYRLSDGLKSEIVSTNANIEYLPRIQFMPHSSTLIYQTLNREQNNLNIYKIAVSVMTFNADAATSVGSTLNNEPTEIPPTPAMASTLIYSEKDYRYVDITDDFYCFADESQFVISSEKGGYRHLYLYDMNGNMIRPLTKGKYEVGKLYGVDENRKVVYFQANYSAPYNKEVMSVGLNGRGLRRLAYDLQAKGGVTNAMFNTDYTRAILIHSSANMPSKYCEYSINGKNEQLLKVLEANDTLLSKMQAAGISAKAFGKMNVAKYRISDKKDNYTNELSDLEAIVRVTDSNAALFDSLYYWIMKPENMEEGRKYPVLMFLYGGPGSQQVLNQYGNTDYWWYAYLVQQGYIVVCVDNRGTGGRGSDFKKCTYLQLGRYETEDQMAAVRYMCDEWDFVDPARIGIWGWSYGGFMSSSCLFKGNDLWKMAIAVAPVTNWRYYDNVYTERFMRTPTENPHGYDANSPIGMAGMLKGNYLLVHGSADDNVHLQNSMDLITALQTNMKQFEFQVYPNKNHSIYGGYTRKHLFTLFTNFIKENL